MRARTMKNHWVWLAGVIGLLVLSPWGAYGAENVSVLMQKAIFAEETEGNLDAAITLYREGTK